MNRMAIDNNSHNINGIISLLKKGASPSFRYHQGTKALYDIAALILESIREDSYPTHSLAIVKDLIKYYDYRLTADYLCAVNTCQVQMLKMYDQLLSTTDRQVANNIRYQLAYSRFLNVIVHFEQSSVSFDHCLENVLQRSDLGIDIYLVDPLQELPLTTLLSQVGSTLSAFIDQQYDVPGLNALERQGLVKSWALPNGKAVISKQSNPHKPNRFRNEQINCRIIADRIGQTSGLRLGQTSDRRDIWLKVARPFAVVHDGYSNRHYALSLPAPGISLEDLLIKEHNQAARDIYLAHYRMILDALYDLGVLWGDMCARNIIVDRSEECIVYHIFDFEKTTIMDGPVSTEDRVIHCRGQICAEELCILCSPEEINKCFKEYFDPTTWDLESSQPVPFSPREEVLFLLRNYGIHEPTLGQYNRADTEILCARWPDTNPMTGLRRYPGHVGFQVEQYLTCAGYDNAIEYEMKLTGVLVSACRYDCLNGLITLLTDVTDQIEGSCLRVEFELILMGKPVDNVMPTQQDIQALVRIIDSLFNSRLEKTSFLKTYAQLYDTML